MPGPGVFISKFHTSGEPDALRLPEDGDSRITVLLLALAATVIAPQRKQQQFAVDSFLIAVHFSLSALDQLTTIVGFIEFQIAFVQTTDPAVQIFR